VIHRACLIVRVERGQFQLDATGRPTAVAGVPPDYFSPTGQLWGNPLYDWEVMRRDGFRLWCARFRRQLERVDLLRLDHFRALAAHWAVPAGALDARAGSWKRTPGWALLRTLRDELGVLPIVAEDLGIITPDVEDLRRGFELPGMRVLQFGFDGSADNPHLPHNYSCDLAAYTGTHDNDTTVGWFRGLASADAQRVEYYLRSDSAGLADGMIRAVLASVARLAIIPAQDLLQLGSQARFNTPGIAARAISVARRASRRRRSSESGALAFCRRPSTRLLGDCKILSRYASNGMTFRLPAYSSATRRDSAANCR